MWAGTNAGYIYVYSLLIPPKEERGQSEVKSEVGKELKLKHHAPVVNIFVVDKNGVPVCSVSEQVTTIFKADTTIYRVVRFVETFFCW